MSHKVVPWFVGQKKKALIFIRAFLIVLVCVSIHRRAGADQIAVAAYVVDA